MSMTRITPQRIALVLTLQIILAPISWAEPLFPNSVVSNDIDFIRPGDPNAYKCLVYQGRDQAEMPDKRSDALFADGVYIFAARFEDGTEVGIWAHPKLKTKRTAKSYAQKVAQRLGHLPTEMRRKLSHVVIHNGDETAFAEDQGRFFVMYSHNIDKRIRTNDLEETVFHEAVHATLDVPHASSRAWRKAQRADGDFVTDYAKRLPKKEDLAESALFAWAHVIHPGRLPEPVAAKIKEIMPARIAYLSELFTSKPIHYRVGAAKGC